MAIPALASDFKEFLKLLNSNGVEYLLIGGYAVGIYGHIRATNDLDIWVSISPENAARIERALRGFGFGAAALTPDLFLTPNNVVRMGVPPIRIEILTSISGVEFELCYAEKETIHEFLLQDSEGILRVAFYHEPEAGGAYWVVWIWDQP